MVRGSTRRNVRRQQAQKMNTASRTDAITKEQSMTLMKNLVRTAISSIAYLRNLFPEDCFKDKRLTGVTVKTLLPHDPEAKLLIQWMEEGVFDALQKRFLDAIIFAIYNKHSENKEKDILLECYTFRMMYPDAEDNSINGGMHLQNKNGATGEVHIRHSKEEIKNATVRMIRTLVTLAQTLRGLPCERYLTVKLLYRDEYTPEDYEPKFFKAASEKDHMAFQTKPVKIRIGKVDTPYHEMSLKIKTVIDSFGDESDNREPVPYDAEESSESENENYQSKMQGMSSESDIHSDKYGINDMKVLPPIELDEFQEEGERSQDDAQNPEMIEKFYVMLKEKLEIFHHLAPRDLMNYLKRTFPELSTATILYLIRMYNKEIASRSKYKVLSHSSIHDDDVRVRLVKMSLEKENIDCDDDDTYNAFKEYVSASRNCVITQLKTKFPELAGSIRGFLEKMTGEGILKRYRKNQFKFASETDSVDENNASKANGGNGVSFQEQGPRIPGLLKRRLEEEDLIMSESSAYEDRHRSRKRRRKVSIIEDPINQMRRPTQSYE